MARHLAARADCMTVTIGSRLRAILARRGLSLNQLAARTGGEVSTSQLSLMTRDLILYPRVSTVQAICRALDVSEWALIGRDEARDRRQADLQAQDGVTSVPVVRLVPERGWVETGQTFAVASAHLLGRRRLFVALVDGGGMSPYVLVGDRILFDPDEPARSEQLVVVLHAGATMAAWRLEAADERFYWLQDGSQLEPARVLVAGAVVYIMRPPPSSRMP